MSRAHMLDPAGAGGFPRSRGLLDRIGLTVAQARLLALVWAASRVGLVAVLLLVVAIRHIPALTAISTWDVQHYMAIARDGFATPDSRAFFPGLPGLMDAGASLGLRMEVTGVLVALVGSALAALALVRLARSTGAGMIAASLWLIAPTTVFTFVGYTEAPFCAAAFWAWERWRSGHRLLGASLAAVACTFRVSGLFLIAALAVMTLCGDGDGDASGARSTDDPQQPSTGHRDLVERLSPLPWLLLPAAVLVAHAWHLQQITGSWTTWYQAQVTGWNRGATSPWAALVNTWQAAQPSSWPGRPEVPVVFFLEIVSMAVGLLTTVVLLRRRHWAQATWIGLQLVAFGTSHWYMSINRAVLLWFPVFLLAGSLLQTRSDESSARVMVKTVLTTVWIALSSVVAALWAWTLFTNGWAS